MQHIQTGSPPCCSLVVQKLHETTCECFCTFFYLWHPCVNRAFRASWRKESSHFWSTWVPPKGREALSSSGNTGTQLTASLSARHPHWQKLTGSLYEVLLSSLRPAVSINNCQTQTCSSQNDKADCTVEQITTEIHQLHSRDSE